MISFGASDDRYYLGLASAGLLAHATEELAIYLMIDVGGVRDARWWTLLFCFALLSMCG